MSSSTQDLIPQLHLWTTFGALFIGVNIAAVLFGLSNIQAFIYFQTHKGTGISFYKLVVIWLWILDALHLALIVHCMYYYLVTNFGNINALTEIVWSFKAQIVVDVLIVYAVHLLYLYRIWIISEGRSRVIPITVAVIELLGSGKSITSGFSIRLILKLSGVAIALIWAVYQCRLFSDLLDKEWSTYMTLGTTTFVDIVIASSLCYLLATSRTGSSSTDSLITKLMAYIINTGILTRYSFFQTIQYLDSNFMQHMFNGNYYYMMPNNFVFLGVEFLLAKLYVNSYLALLNARHYVQANADTGNSYQFDNIYRPELPAGASQDEELQASRQDVCKLPDDDSEVAHPTRFVVSQRPIEVTVQMDSLSV
ncbi:hypothetical protein DEU56DRAFT_910117 [Suillus clintonianus]|uniref:uncharacterized protein n=1 Tax=Suillus clintonianus TaxID=1904413 RepID=UPI001B8848B9|nr:uncharacterized protein DEU56DRAFT_910117 [Suillus clintonianus]KAG2145836.1 hypothetical protein DEU56DRAFT_910117 [Suillus clintonianus]